ncbi:MAG: hypothetical protein H6698_07385 [Myxococcales bacterium]|nr:hypothetical protein [Myxococcales bacterium]MCB9534129.1 hypothetical protein [Myxococcales bacterium]
MSATPTSPETTPRRAAGAAWVTLAALVIAAFAVMVWRQRWIGDDGFINLRVAANLLDGYGPVFNVGERVEAYTSALWLVLVALLGAVTGARLENVAVGLGMFCAVAALPIAVFGALRAWTPRPLSSAEWARLRPFPAGLLVYCALPPAWDYGTSALETPLSALWLALTYAQVVAIAADSDAARTPRLSRALLAAFTAGLGPLVRPDLALFSAGFCAALALSVGLAPGCRWREVLWLAAAAAAVPVASQVFRMGYFAAMVPNTAYAKEAFSSYWSQGWHYFQNFFLKYYLPAPLAAVLVAVGAPAWWAGLRRGRWAVAATNAATVVCGLAAITYIVRVGGDFMHGRMFLHGLFGLLLPVMVTPLPRLAASRRAMAVAGVALALTTAWAAGIATSIRMGENEWAIGDERGWYTSEAGVYNAMHIEDYANFAFHRDGARFRDELAGACGRDVGARELATGCQTTLFLDEDRGFTWPHELRRPVAEGAVPEGVGLVAARIPIGIVGFLVGPSLHLADRAGLSDPVHARIELLFRSRPGHEKIVDDSWIVARYTAPTFGEDARVSAARRALGCGELAELHAATTEPLTADRFVANVRAARRFHTLRVPADPYEAERRLCGVGVPHEENIGGGGGSPWYFRCPDGTSVDGLIGRARDGHAALSAQCGAGAPDDDERRGPPRSPWFGASPGAPTSSPCEGAAVGVSGTLGAVVESVALICPDGPARSLTLTDPSEQAAPFELRCPEGTTLRGIRGRVGDLVDALGVICM